MFRPKLNYYTKVVISLSLENYHNAGLTPEETKEAIESIRDPFSSNSNFHCTPSGINRNWSITTYGPERHVGLIVEDIQYLLDRLLEKKKLNV